MKPEQTVETPWYLGNMYCHLEELVTTLGKVNHQVKWEIVCNDKQQNCQELTIQIKPIVTATSRAQTTHKGRVS